MYKGKNLALGDVTGIIQPSRDLPRESLIAELIMNCLEAVRATDGRVEIDVLPYTLPSGKVVTAVLDSGHGMTAADLEYCFQGVGFSKKRLGGHSGHFGWGPKPLAIHFSREKIEWISWKRPDAVFATALGENDSGWGPLETNGLYVRQVSLPKQARDLSGKKLQSGTLAICYGMEYDAKAILKFLNLRLFQVPHPIRVWRQHGEDLFFDEVQGFAACMLRLSDHSGVVDLPHVTVNWWILKTPEDRAQVRATKALETRHFSTQGLSKVLPSGEQGLLLSCKWQKRPTNEMVSWSIPFGQDRICLALTCKGDKIRPSSNRYDVDGWNEEVARSEWRNHLSHRDDHGLPHEDVAALAEHLEKVGATRQETPPFRTLVDNLHAMCGLSAVPNLPSGARLQGIIPEIVGRENSSGRKASGSRTRSSGTSNQQGGRFQAEPFSNDRELDGKVAEIRGTRILFNPDHPIIRRETDKTDSPRERQVIVACFAVAFEALANECMRHFKRLPTDDELELSAMSNVMAKLRANTDGRVILPLEKISVAQKPKRKDKK